jgi:polyphosphate kinase
MTERLYAASNAGVKVTLFVRGFCCLKPGVPGMSENIEVISVIGRFLEHSRVFHFASGQEDPLDGEWFISSADWMYRNLSNRVEAAVPVRGGEARRKLHRIFEIMGSDRRNAWLLRTDGGYDRRVLNTGEQDQEAAERGTFATLMREAMQ